MNVDRDELLKAMAVMEEVGLTVMLEERWDNLVAWLNQEGWPPKGWVPRVNSRAS